MLLQAGYFKKNDDDEGEMAPQGVRIQIIANRVFRTSDDEREMTQRMKTTEGIGSNRFSARVMIRSEK